MSASRLCCIRWRRIRAFTPSSRVPHSLLFSPTSASGARKCSSQPSRSTRDAQARTAAKQVPKFDTNLGTPHWMRNELSFSSEVAPDGSSWHVYSFDEEAYACIVQASENIIKEGCKQTGNLGPRDLLRGRWDTIEIVSWYAASSFC